DRLAVVLLGQYDAVADVRGPVVARRLEAELVPLLGEGVIDESLREPAGDVERLLVPLRVVPGARGPLLLVAHAVALVDLHQRLDLRAVVPPAGPHVLGPPFRGPHPA